MRRRAWLFGIGMVTVLSLAVTVTDAGEIALDKVPKVVLDKVKARFANAEVTGAGKEKTEDGKEVYEISLENESYNNIDVTVTPEGTIILIEQQIERKGLPAPVGKTLEAKYPKSRYRIVEEVIEVEGADEKLVYYEVLLVTPEKKMWAVQLDPEGKIVAVEEKSEEEDDE